MTSPILLETIHIEDGKPLNLYYHNQRFNRTRREIFKIYREFDLATIIKAPAMESCRCRLLYSDEILSVEYLPYRPKEIKRVALVESDVTYRYKFADRSGLDQLMRESIGSDDILIIQDKLVTDTTIANTAFLDNGVWFTPSRPLLEGTTRQRLLDNGFLIPKDIHIGEIDRFDGFALMNAMIGFKVINPIWFKK
ncbi:MAG: aminotransferase class IV [Campylobacterota bacterium]|nr:aminotransferase class IV [Campylobacterota bacterium]